MEASSTIVRPQTVLIQVTIFPDPSGFSVTPAFFGVDTTKFMLNRKLIALESFCSADVPFSPITPGMPVVSLTQFRACALTLLREPGNGVQGGDFYKNVPLEKFRRVVNGQIAVASAPEMWRCDPTGVSWSDSFISVGTNFATGNNLPVAALFQATYLFESQDPRPYTRVKLRRHV